MKSLSRLSRYGALVVFVILVSQGKMTLWLGVFGLGVLLSLAFGRGYCGYVCPMNAVMGPASWISQKLRLKRRGTPGWLLHPLFPWVFVGLTLAVMIAAKRVLQVQLPVLLFWVALAFVATLFFKPEVFHNRLCPFGAVLSITGRFTGRSAFVDSQACIGCKLCEKACEAEAVQIAPATRQASILKARCHQCMACQTVCPAGAIRYGKEFSKRKMEVS